MAVKINKLKTFFKDLKSGLVIGIAIGIVGSILLVLIKGFIAELIINLAFATGIMAVGTLILAGFTYWNIVTSRAQQKQDRKERKLDRVIDWATQILECGRDPMSLRYIRGAKEVAYNARISSDVRAGFNVISWRGVHIGYIADSLGHGGQGIKIAVEYTRTLIRQQTKLLMLSEEKKLKDNAAIGRHRTRLDNMAKLVIEVAVKQL